jgi:hypothetical protein
VEQEADRSESMSNMYTIEIETAALKSALCCGSHVTFEWYGEGGCAAKNDGDDSDFRHVILKRVMDVQFISKFLRRFWRDAEFTNTATLSHTE